MILESIYLGYLVEKNLLSKRKLEAKMKVTLEEVGGNVDKMIKKFLKKVKKSKVVEEVMERRYYVKPSVKERLAKIARARVLKKLREEQFPEE